VTHLLIVSDHSPPYSQEMDNLRDFLLYVCDMLCAVFVLSFTFLLLVLLYL
jgi:uncharacterized protein YutD